VTTPVRAALALLLLAGIYVVAIILVAASLVFAFGILLSPGQGFQALQSLTLVINLGLLGAPAILAVVIGLFRVSGATGRVKDSVPLSHADAPALWDAVTELAGTVGTRPPAELRVVAAANAEVTEETRLLGLLTGTRRLYVGMPLLLGLTVDELRAVLCHELGHYARRDTRIGAVTYRGAAALEEMRDQLRHPPGRLRFNVLTATFRRIFTGYASVYLRLSLAMRRRQEILADSASVAVAGQAATAGALRSVHALAAAWHDFLAQYVSTVRAAGFMPDGIFDGFSDMLADTLFQDVLATLRRSPPDTAKSPYDSHPSLAARLRAIDAGGNGPDDPDRTPAIRMLAEPDRVGRAVQDVLLPRDPAGPPTLPWPEWADLVAEALAVNAARELLDATRRVALQPAPTLGSVLDLMESGATHQLAFELCNGTAGRFAETSPEPSAVRRLRAALAALVGCVLTQSGYASWRLCWTGPSTLAGLDIAVVEFPGLVDAAVRSPAQVVNLRGQLAYLGVPVSVPLAPVQVSVPGSQDAQAAGVLRQLGAKAGATPAQPGPSYRLPRMAWLGICLLIGGIVLSQQLNSNASRYPLPPVQLNTRAPWFDPPSPAVPSPARLPLSVLVPSFAVPTVVVRPGDTLSALACRYQTTVAYLEKLNNLGPSSVLQVGQVLLIPDGAVAAAPGTAGNAGCP
jgi:Zn-dependent protease with chaperone function